MSIADKLTKLAQYKSDIKTALNNKGVAVDDKLSEWADKINRMEAGSPSGDDVDYSYEYIPDDYTYIYFNPSSATTAYKLKIQPAIANAVIIDWGDGTTSTTSSTSLTSYSHTYSSLNTNANMMLIKLYAAPSTTYTIAGTGTASTTMGLENIAPLCYDFRPAKNCTISNYGLYGTAITQYNIPIKNTSLANYTCNSNYGVREIKIPSNITALGNYTFSNNHSVKEVIIPNTITKLGTADFSGCLGLRKVIWNSTQKFIQNFTFIGCYNLVELDLSSATQIFRFGTSATSTTVGTPNYIAINPNLHIIIPKNLYNSWKSSSYWTTFKNFLYWRDTDGTLKNTTV